MYKLYGNIAGWKLIDISKDEKDIIDTLTLYVENNHTMDYMIIKQLRDRDELYKCILNEQDYRNYLEEYSILNEPQIKRTRK